MAVLMLFVLLVQGLGLSLSGTAGNVCEMNGTYSCNDGNGSKLETNTPWIPRGSCNETSLLMANKVIYSKEEGFIPPIRGSPTDGVFLIEGCPVIVFICQTYDGKEIRITYTGMTDNTPHPISTGVKDNTTPTILTAVIFIGVTLALVYVVLICYAVWKIFKSKKTSPSAEERNLTAVESTGSSVASSMLVLSQPDSVQYED